MTRLVTFADGFSAAAPPDVTPGAQEDFALLNNQAVAVNLVNASADQLIFDDTNTKAVFVGYECERYDGTDTYRQQGEFMVIRKIAGWEIQYGNYHGDDLLQISAISDVKHVVLTVNPATGAMTYQTGNMTGFGPLGNLKTIITRILV